jgi:Zn-dependent protease/CBS domain-containing protein
MPADFSLHSALPVFLSNSSSYSRPKTNQKNRNIDKLKDHLVRHPPSPELLAGGRKNLENPKTKAMFTKRFKLFNLLGFPIFIDLSWFVIVLLIVWSLATNLFPQFYEGLQASTYWWMGLAGAMGLFISILAHELGHAVVARRFDVPIRGITLFIFGGVAEMTKEPPSAKAEFLVAIAGPVVSVIIGIVCYTAGAYFETSLAAPIVGVLWYLGIINGIVVVFNMIPAFPLDGGRVLRSILWHFNGSLRRSTRITASIGSGFGLVLILLGVISFVGGNFIGGMWQFLIGLFLRGAAQMSYQQVLIRNALEGETIERFMQQAVVSVPPSATIRQLVEDYIYRHHHKMFPVTEDGRLIGCVTTRDVQEVPRDQWDQHSVGEIVKPCTDENTIRRDADAMQALSSMSQNGASRLMVVDDGHLEGILSLKDLLKFISLKVELEEGDGAIAQNTFELER